MSGALSAGGAAAATCGRNHSGTRARAGIAAFSHGVGGCKKDARTFHSACAVFLAMGSAAFMLTTRYSRPRDDEDPFDPGPKVYQPMVGASAGRAWYRHLPDPFTPPHGDCSGETHLRPARPALAPNMEVCDRHGPRHVRLSRQGHPRPAANRQEARCDVVDLKVIPAAVLLDHECGRCYPLGPHA